MDRSRLGQRTAGDDPISSTPTPWLSCSSPFSNMFKHFRKLKFIIPYGDGGFVPLGPLSSGEGADVRVGSDSTPRWRSGDGSSTPSCRRSLERSEMARSATIGPARHRPDHRIVGARRPRQAVRPAVRWDVITPNRRPCPLFPRPGSAIFYTLSLLPNVRRRVTFRGCRASHRAPATAHLDPRSGRGGGND
jgi:hypothetical protein